MIKVTLRASSHVPSSLPLLELLIPSSVTHEKYQRVIICELYLSIFFYIGGIALYIEIYIIYLYVLFIVSNRPLYLCCTFADDFNVLGFIVRFVPDGLFAHLPPPPPPRPCCDSVVDVDMR